MTRSDIRTRIRDYLYEDTADLWSDTQLNRCISEEMLSMPAKTIYLEEIWTTTTVVDQQDYSLPSGTVEVEKVERNDGTSTDPYWVELNGVDTYAGALWLPYKPDTAEEIRIHIQKYFTALTDDITATDIPDPQVEVLVKGAAVRAYQMLMGYFVDAKNWDSVSKPDGISMSQVQGWFRDAQKDYNSTVQLFRQIPRPRKIDLVN